MFENSSGRNCRIRSGDQMRKIIIAAAVLFNTAPIYAQDAAPTTTPAPPTVAANPATQPNDMETLRQQVQSLTDTVKALQQQVKDQQTALEKMSGGRTPLPSNAGETPSASPASGATAPPLFPTNDSSVVASALPPETNAAGSAPPAGTTAFPTTDASVTSETISSTGAGASFEGVSTCACC